jgi:hypothetical protein
MKTNILVTASALSDRDLLARLEVLASKEREASAELVAHLAVLDGRPALYAAQGYGTLFSYCTQALLLSEDAACSRIEARSRLPALSRHPRAPGFGFPDPDLRPPAGTAPHGGEPPGRPRQGQP